jgi:protein phosphatase
MVFDMVRQGVITEEQARLSAQSNVITRALGIKADIEVETTTLPYLLGDRFLLCTDGIHGSMPESELIKCATDRKQSIGGITDNIATIVDGRGRSEGGGHDNLTLAILETNTNSILKYKMNKTAKILLAALSIICVISLILNVVSFKHKVPTDQELKSQVEQLDSINRQLNDSITSLSSSIKTLQADSVRSHDKIASQHKQIEKLKRDNQQPSSK